MTKYYKMLGSKQIVLTEEQYEILLKRFSPSRMKRDGDIDIACPLCVTRRGDCVGCTMHKFEREKASGSGCISVLESVLATPCGEWDMDCGVYHLRNWGNKSAATRQVKQIKDFLLTFKKLSVRR